jgi:hypothetical protein
VGDVVDHVDTGDVLLLEQETAWLSCSLKMATSTLAPVTSLRPEDCTWNTARCSTRWKPRVGWVSRSESPAGISGVVESMNSLRSAAQLVDVGADLAQHVQRDAVVEQRQQQVLHRHELVTLGLGLAKGFVEGDFEIFAEHMTSYFLGCRAGSLSRRSVRHFHRGDQRVLILLCILIHLLGFSFRDVARKYARPPRCLEYAPSA